MLCITTKRFHANEQLFISTSQCKQTQTWSSKYIHNYSTVKKSAINAQVSGFLYCTLFSCIQICISMMNTWVIWAFKLMVPGEDMCRNQLQSHQLSWTLPCALQLNYIMNTECADRVEHGTLNLCMLLWPLFWKKARKKEKDAHPVFLDSVLQRDLIQYIWSNMQPSWHVKGK